jgi:hypothetical protein
LQFLEGSLKRKAELNFAIRQFSAAADKLVASLKSGFLLFVLEQWLR